MINKEKHLTLRLEDCTYNSIELASKESNVSNSQFIRQAIEKALEMN
jgi:predicted DNA-binding protein